MPVESLASARAFFEALGFIVAPDAAHPFGTTNACVFFADGSYLEPLAVGDAALCRAEARDGNVFVRWSEAFRARRKLPGLSGIAFASDDAAADHAAFRRDGISDGEILEFSRPFTAPGGKAGILTFRLAFAADRRSRTLFFFACEAVGGFAPDRSALTAHPNGATGIARVVLCAPAPEHYLPILESLVGPRQIANASFGGSFSVGNTSIEVLAPTDLLMRYGRGRAEAEGLTFEGVVISVADLAAMSDQARQGGFALSGNDDRLVVSLGEAAACFIAFEVSV